jgi:formate dehydrogenase accessory protein FdhE
MTDSWQRRIDRAKALARTDPRAAALLTQYAAILAAQRTCHDALAAHAERLTGSIERDLAELRPGASELFRTIATATPAQAMRGAPTDAAALDQLLADGWRTTSMPFLARVVLQPYAEVLATLAGSAGSTDPANTHPALIPKEDRRLDAPPERATCPFCGGLPQVSVLRQDSAADGGGRSLECGTCATAWPMRRVLCAYCGEEDEHRLGYVQAADFEHVRVDVCDTCQHFIKTVDLTRLGLAVPLVDEVASGALDIWALERGYTKVTANLIGL